MYDYETGAFIGTVNDDWTEHFETTYYIRYNLEKALYSLNKIFDEHPNFKDFSNSPTYYHFYIDSLVEAVGKIYKRFHFNNRSSIDNERVKRNISEYNYGILNDKNNFTEINYKNLNINVRNFVEHIDEKDEFLMKDNLFYGTFNVIFEEMDSKIKNDLLNEEKKQNNLLNLIDKTYRVYSQYDTNASGKRKYKFYQINLVELKNELLKMKAINDKIHSYLSYHI